MDMTADTGQRATNDVLAAPSQARRSVAGLGAERPRSAKAREASQLVLLLQRVAEKDPTALRGLYDRTSSKLHGVILRIVRDRSDADDILQDVYLTVWRRADRFDLRQGSVITWLCAIARNRAIDLLRRRPAQSLLAAESELETIPDNAPSTFDRLQRSDEGREVHRVLDKLEPRAAWAIRTAFFNDWTYGELARHQGIPLSTMKSCIRRGLLQLRSLVDRGAE